MKSLDTAARPRTTVARGANLNSETALEPLSTSAGICDSMDTSFEAADFISDAGKSKESRFNDWLASSFFSPVDAQ